MRIPVQQIQVPRQLLDPVDLPPPLDLHGDGPPVAVPAQDVHRPDRRHVLAPDERVTVPQRLDPVREQFLKVCFHAVLDQPGVHPEFVRGVVEDLLHRDDELLARLVHDGPHPRLLTAALLEGAGRRHPVQRLVGPVVRMDRHAAVGLHEDQTGRRGKVGGEPARVVDGAPGDDETHGAQRYSTRPPPRDPTMPADYSRTSARFLSSSTALLTLPVRGWPIVFPPGGGRIPVFLVRPRLVAYRRNRRSRAMYAAC